MLSVWSWTDEGGVFWVGRTGIGERVVGLKVSCCGGH